MRLKIKFELTDFHPMTMRDIVGKSLFHKEIFQINNTVVCDSNFPENFPKIIVNGKGRPNELSSISQNIHLCDTNSSSLTKTH